MGYFSELSILLQERQEVLMNDASWEDRSYPSIKQQLIWRLEDFKEYLRQLIEKKQAWETAYCGTTESDWSEQYKQWPNCWPPRNPEAFYLVPNAFGPEEVFDMEDIMEAIASTQYRLLSYGYDADAEEIRRAKLAEDRPLDGQLTLPLAA